MQFEIDALWQLTILGIGEANSFCDEASFTALLKWVPSEGLLTILDQLS